jgi:hypothetical protein
MTARPPAHHLFEQPWPDGEFWFFQLGHVVDDLLAAASKWAHQIATVTDDYDRKKSRFEALGYKIAAESDAGVPEQSKAR